MSAPQDKTDFARAMEAVALRLLGEPKTKAGNQWRYGANGSLSIDITEGTFFSHESKTGGGVIDLVAQELRIPKVEAPTWLRTNGFIPDREPPPKPDKPERVVATYVYQTADRANYLRIQRTDRKNFWQRHWDGRNWAKGKPKGPKIPYRLPELVNAVHDTVLIVEGEKDVDNLTRLGFVATSCSEGANAWTPDLNCWFEGKTVYVLPDNDDEGRRHAQLVARNLHGMAAEVRVVGLPGLKLKGDVSDWLSAGNDHGGLIDLCRTFPVWQPQEPEPATPEAGSPERTQLEVLNEKYAVVRDGSKVRVLTFEQERQKGHVREVPVYLAFEDFRNLLLNRTVRVSEDKKVPLGHWWLKHPERKQFDGVTFEPGGAREVDSYLNLWRGWGVEPKKGDWTLMRRHIREVLADGDKAADTYILNWCAWAVQHPAERAQAAIVFKGKKGTGKGTLGNALCQIFGQHGTHISSAEHLAGRFNSHLRDACLLFADEAYWPGDKGAEGSLKRLVTEPDLFIEAKGRDGVTVANMLHIIMASNEQWIVPAGEDERRYAVFTVSAAHMQDEEWFLPLYAEIAAGGLGAMLYDLLAMDLGDWHPRKIPKTDGLLEQQAQSLRPEDAFWVELLQSGRLWGADPDHPNCAVSNGYEEDVPNLYGGTKTVRRKALYDQARETSPRLKSWNDHLLGQFLKGHGCSNTKKVMRRRGWTFPDLTELRSKWEERFPGWKWNDEETGSDSPKWRAED